MLRLMAAAVVVLLLVSQASAGDGFDHSSFDQLLRKHVLRDGRVDYAGLKRNQRQLDAYLDALDKVKLGDLSRDEQLALWINAYNAATLRLIVDHYPLKSIMDIPEGERWKAKRWHVGGKVYSLDEIENQQIRPVFKEPRIHFAVNCASVGCPPLRPEAYTGAKLDRQLTEQAKQVHADPRFLKLVGREIHLTKLYEWYADDFKKDGQSVLQYAAHYSAPLAKRLTRRDKIPPPVWIEYDWALNSVD